MDSTPAVYYLAGTVALTIAISRLIKAFDTQRQVRAFVRARSQSRTTPIHPPHRITARSHSHYRALRDIHIVYRSIQVDWKCQCNHSRRL